MQFGFLFSRPRPLSSLRLQIPLCPPRLPWKKFPWKKSGGVFDKSIAEGVKLEERGYRRLFHAGGKKQTCKKKSCKLEHRKNYSLILPFPPCEGRNEKGSILHFPSLKNKGVRRQIISSLNFKELFGSSICTLPKHYFRGVLQEPVHGRDIFIKYLTPV